MKSLQKYATLRNNFTRINLVMLLGALILILGFNVRVSAQLAGQVPLKPRNIPQFVDPLPHFAGQRLDARDGGNMTVTMRSTQQIAVSTGTVLAGGIAGVTQGVGFANLWAYELQYGATTKPAYWPAFTIEAQQGNALHVTYVNALTAPNGIDPARYSDVGLIVDQTLHWADPLMQMGSFDPYLGDPPAVVHLHGGEVPPLSDGGPDSWFTPGNAQTGHAFNPEPYFYPNTQEATTLWFHDHALGATRLNVYAGMAGFYFLRGADEEEAKLPGWSGDDLVQEVAPLGKSGVFNPTPYRPEIEIAIQDRMFDTTGKLYFPNLPTNPTIHPVWTPEFVGDVITVNGKTWPYLSVAPRRYRFRLLNGSNARFYELSFGKKGPVITQIGTDGGFLDAPVPIAGRLVMGPGERADVIIDFTNFAGQTLILDNTARTPYPGGAPVTGSTTGRIMQFVVNGLMVDGPDANTVADDNSIPQPSLRPTTPLVKLTNFAGAPAVGVPVVKTRQLTLNEVMGMGGPLEVLVNNTKWSGLSLGTTVRTDFTAVPHDPNQQNPDPLMDFTYYSETMDEGTTEIWQIINLTADAHPIHLHLVQFQLMSRQPFSVKGYNTVYNAAFPGGILLDGYGPPKAYDFYATAPNIPAAGPIYGGNPDVRPFLLAPQRGANPNEQGWKDTFIMYPGEVTTVIARWAPTDKAANLDPTVPANEMWFPFDPNGGHGYVWHCHIIDHEDNEMMRPYNVTLNPARSSASLAKHAAAEELSATTTAIHTFELNQNFPNPFNPSTSIAFTLPAAGEVKLAIYNIRGELVHNLVDGHLEAGAHRIVWNSTDANGNRVASGVYFYRLSVNGFVSQKKLVLTK